MVARSSRCKRSGDAARPVDSEAPRDLDAEVFGAGAAAIERVEQFRMGGDAGAAADQLKG